MYDRTYCSSMPCFFEYENSELVGTKMDSHIQNSILEELLSNKPEIRFETHLTTRSGADVPVSVSKSLVKTKSCSPVGYILICHDIRTRWQMERQLLNSARLATVGETTSSRKAYDAPIR
jgi:hypothetical protein